MSSQNTDKNSEGLRSIKTTGVFRLVNFELYAKQNKVIMVIGLACITGALGYITYMRAKYERSNHYLAKQDDGNEIFLQKHSKWDD